MAAICAASIASTWSRGSGIEGGRRVWLCHFAGFKGVGIEVLKAALAGFHVEAQKLVRIPP